MSKSETVRSRNVIMEVAVGIIAVYALVMVAQFGYQFGVWLKG